MASAVPPAVIEI